MIGERATLADQPPAENDRYATIAYGRPVKTVILDGQPWYGFTDAVKAARLNRRDRKNARERLRPEDIRIKRLHVGRGSYATILINMIAFLDIATQQKDPSIPGSATEALRRRILSDTAKVWMAESNRASARESSRALSTMTEAAALSAKAEKDKKTSEDGLAKAIDKQHALKKENETLKRELQDEKTARTAAEKTAALAIHHERHERAVVETLLAESQDLEKAIMERAREAATKAKIGEAATAALRAEVASLRKKIAAIGEAIAGGGRDDFTSTEI